MNAAAAKRASEKRLRDLGVEVNPHLRCIEEQSELSPRSPQEVAARAWVMSHIAYVGYGSSGSEMKRLLEEANLLRFASPFEIKLLSKPSLKAEEKGFAGWLAEAVHGCAWALGLVDTKEIDDCPNTLAAMFRPKSDSHSSIEGARLRPSADLYRRADLTFRLHWALRQATLERRQLVLPEAAILMRRRSLDWIIGLPYEWDDIPLDT